MTTALEVGEGSPSRPGRSLLPGKTRYPLYRWLGGPQGRSGQVRKISPPTRIRSPDRPARSQSLYRLHYPAVTLVYTRLHSWLRIRSTSRQSGAPSISGYQVYKQHSMHIVMWNEATQERNITTNTGNCLCF